MCLSAGSLDQAIAPCPMCKVFVPPNNQPCPHKRERCTNRAAHPRMDVYYLTNAEVERFNGCGFCKWNNYNISTGRPPTYSNRGWPGCCRAPTPNEYDMIELFEWNAVSTAHHVPIPPEVKQYLTMYMPPKSKNPSSPSGRNTPSKSTTSTRRNATATSPRSTVLSTKAMNTPMNTPSSPASPTDRARGSSHHTTGTHSANISRNSSSNAISSSIPSGAHGGDGSRRRSVVPVASPDRRADRRDSPNSSPARRSLDIENPSSTSASRRTSSLRRPAVTPATTSVSVSKVVVDAKSTAAADAATRRRSLVAGGSPISPVVSPALEQAPVAVLTPATATAAKIVPPTSAEPDAPAAAVADATPVTSDIPTTTADTPNANANVNVIAIPIAKPPSPPSSRSNRDSFLAPRPKPEPIDTRSASGSSSGSSDGMSDSTVTSDGGFTDYLSDESEAELQRQAEERAVVAAQLAAEEREFKLARQQLAGIGLKPPKSWNPTNTPPASPAVSNARPPPPPPPMMVSRMSAHKQPASFGSAAVSMMQQPEARV